MMDCNPYERVSLEQLKILVDFISEHPFIASTPYDQHQRSIGLKLVKKLAAKLNSCDNGSVKTAKGWIKYWTHFKYRMKMKRTNTIEKMRMEKPTLDLRTIEKEALLTLVPYLDNREKLFKLIIKNYGQPAKVEDSEVEIQQQPYQEQVFWIEENKSNDGESEEFKFEGENSKLPSDDTLRNDEESEEIKHEDVNSELPSDNTLRNMYPEWLVRVEKMRAEAELMRAKAEQRRADASAKIAEATMIQAQALKTMAKAMTETSSALKVISMAMQPSNNHNAYFKVID